MGAKHKQIEVFTAACPLCEEAVQLVKNLACPECDVSVLDLREESIAKRAREYGVFSVPTVVVDGRIADCCRRSEINREILLAAGVGWH